MSVFNSKQIVSLNDFFIFYDGTLSTRFPLTLDHVVIHFRPGETVRLPRLSGVHA